MLALICPFLDFIGSVFAAALCVLLSFATLRYVFSSPRDIYATDALAQAREQAEDLATELEALVRHNEEWNTSVRKIMTYPESWNDSYLDDARAALAAYKESLP